MCSYCHAVLPESCIVDWLEVEEEESIFRSPASESRGEDFPGLHFHKSFFLNSLLTLFVEYEVDTIGKLTGEEKARRIRLLFRSARTVARLQHPRPGKGPGISRWAHELSYRFAPDRHVDRKRPENGNSKVESLAFKAS